MHPRTINKISDAVDTISEIFFVFFVHLKTSYYCVDSSCQTIKYD